MNTWEGGSELDGTHSHSFQYDEYGVYGLIEAVAWVKSVDPVDLRPLQSIVDCDALKTLIESSNDSEVTVSFEYEQCRVEIDSQGEIKVEYHNFLKLEQMKDVWNVLVLGPTDFRAVTNACGELLTGEQSAEEDILYVGFEVADVNDWDGLGVNVQDPPSPTTVVCVGDFKRGTSTSSNCIDGPQDRADIEFVPTSGDLVELGITINDCIAGRDEDWRQTTMCFDSLTHLLNENGLEHVFQFISILSAKIRSVDGVAHYHLDPKNVRDETIRTLEPLFDAVVSIDEAGGVTVEGQ